MNKSDAFNLKPFESLLQFIDGNIKIRLIGTHDTVSYYTLYEQTNIDRN